MKHITNDLLIKKKKNNNTWSLFPLGVECTFVYTVQYENGIGCLSGTLFAIVRVTLIMTLTYQYIADNGCQFVYVTVT